MNEIISIEGWALLAPQSEGEEPRVRDLDIAERAGLKNKYDIRPIIRDNREELERHGKLEHFLAGGEKVGKGRPGKEFWLNEDQACALIILLRTPTARELRVALVRLFGMVRRGVLSGADSELRAALDAQNATLALALRRLGDMERGMRLLSARAADDAMVHTNRGDALALRNLLIQAADACSTEERRVTFKAMEGVIRVRVADERGEGWNVPGYLSLKRSVLPIVREMLVEYIDGRRHFMPAKARRRASTLPRVRRRRVGRGQQVLFPRAEKASA